MKPVFSTRRTMADPPTSISTPPDLRSGAALIASGSQAREDAFVASLTGPELRALPYLFDFWALPHQLPPGGDWKTWVIMGGRGAGKTRAGAEWVRSQVEGATPRDPGRASRLAIVAETYNQARDVMVFGESGIMACTPPDRIPKWNASERALRWPNGAEARIYSASDPEALRGPQFDAAWADEIGCAAIDKGTNEPNRFLDPKSSESSVPKYSNGGRDDLIQMQYLKAMAEFWGDPSNYPVSDVYGADMVDPARMFVWAWDARPYPFFPGNADVWSDGENYGRGHWLTGRATSRALANVVREICAEGGVSDVDTDGLYGVMRGFAPAPGDGARSRLQSLLLAHSADAVEKDGKLVFRNRNAAALTRLTDDDLARGEGASLVSLTRSPEAEVSGRVRLNFIEADADYEVRAVDSIFPDEVSRGIAESELALAMTSGEARATVDRWLSEARVARDTASFALPPSRSIGAGDIVRLETRAATGMYRVDRVEDAGLKQVEAVRVEAGIYEPGAVEASQPLVGPVPVALPVWARVLDLPAVPGGEEKFAPWVVATAKPWSGDVAVYSSRDGTSWRLDDVLSQPAAMGQTLNPLPVAAPGLWDRGGGLEVRLVHGALSSVDEPTLFAGGNTAVILDAAGTTSEVFQFRDAELVGPDTWSLSMRLRGQKGTDATMPTEWPAGSTVVVVDLALRQLAETPGPLEAARRYRIGPASKPVDHRAYVDITHPASGLALKPFRPAHARAVRDAAGALNVTWIRRSRVDGDNWTLADVPLGEAFERYRIRLFAGGTLRREVVLTAPGWVYSAAEQNADGIGTACTIEVAQISDRVGPGHLARMEING